MRRFPGQRKRWHAMSTMSWIAFITCIGALLYSTLCGFTHSDEIYPEFFELQEQQTTYDKQCQWTYDEAGGGYAPVANEGRRHLAGYVCAAMFRDMSDYVYSWPYHRFSEYDVWVADLELAARNLPPVPIIYTQIDAACNGDVLRNFLKPHVRRPYVLITGENDLGVPNECRHANQILDDPYLVKWFAQNNDGPHPKVIGIPIGLNCFEHAPEMHSVLQDFKRNGRPDKAQLLRVNFGYSHHHRHQSWQQLCGGSKNFTTCIPKSSGNNIRCNPHLIGFYKDFATFDYVASPRGNGLDCHRFWEGLYLGVTPIVERSPLDSLYERAENVLFVNSFADVTYEMLIDELPKFRKIVEARGDDPPKVLTRAYWKGIIDGVRDKALVDHNLQDNNPRKRCWGLNYARDSE